MTYLSTKYAKYFTQNVYLGVYFLWYMYSLVNLQQQIDIQI